MQWMNELSLTQEQQATLQQHLQTLQDNSDTWQNKYNTLLAQTQLRSALLQAGAHERFVDRMLKTVPLQALTGENAKNEAELIADIKNEWGDVFGTRCQQNVTLPPTPATSPALPMNDDEFFRQQRNLRKEG